MAAPRLEVQAYDQEEKTECLLELAYQGGNATAAHRALKKRLGWAPNAQTLTKWTESEHELWHECQSRMKADILPRLADDAEKMLAQAQRVEEKLLDRLEEQLDSGEDIPVQHVATALQKVAVAKAQNNEKIIGPIRGRPTMIIEHKEPTAILERLGEIYASLPKAAQAVLQDPVVDADVVEPSPSEEEIQHG